MTTSVRAPPICPAETMDRTLVIDCFPVSVERYLEDHLIVAVDVIRASTMVVTAVALGFRCLIARDLRDAFALRDRLEGAILAGEIRGDIPDGFDMNNSPSDLEDHRDAPGDLVTLSTSGTALMLAAAKASAGAFVASLRNYRTTARALAEHPGPIAVIGAGSRGEFREEDQLCCAWIADELMRFGHRPRDERTHELIRRWRGTSPEACDSSKSVAYLRRSGQLRDRDFIVSRIDDLDLVCTISGNEVQRWPGAVGQAALAARSQASSISGGSGARP
jgi:2-phosphosulfolactate phosphatase